MSSFTRKLTLAVAILWAFPYAPHALHAQFFEFVDDFGKPAWEQRDPWEERIETERHDFTQSAVTVGRHVMQLEAGYTFFSKEANGRAETAHTTPEMLLRIGLSEDIEFRLRWDYAWQFLEDEPDQIGSEDLRFSFKLQMTRQECGGLLPTSALELRGSAPTGARIFSTGRVEGGVDYIYQWELFEGATLAGSTGFGTNGYGDFGLVAEEPTQEQFTGISQSAVLGFELTESNTVYIEWYSIYSVGLEDEYVIAFVNVGIDHYVTDNFVLDVRAGVGLSKDADDFFVGVGGGYRF